MQLDLLFVLVRFRSLEIPLYRVKDATSETSGRSTPPEANLYRREHQIHRVVSRKFRYVQSCQYHYADTEPLSQSQEDNHLNPQTFSLSK